jgi:hypothetical protein
MLTSALVLLSNIVTAKYNAAFKPFSLAYNNLKNYW